MISVFHFSSVESHLMIFLSSVVKYFMTLTSIFFCFRSAHNVSGILFPFIFIPNLFVSVVRCRVAALRRILVYNFLAVVFLKQSAIILKSYSTNKSNTALSILKNRPFSTCIILPQSPEIYGISIY